MKRLPIAMFVLLSFAAIPARAAKPTGQPLSLEGGISPGEVRATPEMWFYQQYQREYRDPNMAVRRNAEYRAAQRRRRLAALKWFGFSNQRPRAGTDPFHGDWSPRWTSNNNVYPFRWNGVARPWVIAWPWRVVWSGSSTARSY